jgi:hypothetical protein
MDMFETYHLPRRVHEPQAHHSSHRTAFFPKRLLPSRSHHAQAQTPPMASRRLLYTLLHTPTPTLAARVTGAATIPSAHSLHLARFFPTTRRIGPGAPRRCAVAAEPAPLAYRSPSAAQGLVPESSSPATASLENLAEVFSSRCYNRRLLLLHLVYVFASLEQTFCYI